MTGVRKNKPLSVRPASILLAIGWYANVGASERQRGGESAGARSSRVECARLVPDIPRGTRQSTESGAAAKWVLSTLLDDGWMPTRLPPSLDKETNDCYTRLVCSKRAPGELLLTRRTRGRVVVAAAPAAALATIRTARERKRKKKKKGSVRVYYSSWAACDRCLAAVVAGVVVTTYRKNWSDAVCRATRVGPWNMLARPFKGARQPVTGMFLFLDLRRVANAAPSVAALSDAPPEIEGTRRPMEGSKRCVSLSYWAPLWSRLGRTRSTRRKFQLIA